MVHFARVVFALSLLSCTAPAAGAEEPPPADTAASLRIRDLLAAGELAEAETLARASLRETEATHGPESLATAYALDDLVDALRRTAPADSATLALARRAVALKEPFADEIPLELASSENNLGVVLQERGDLDGAALHYERTIALREANGGTDDVRFAYPLNNLGLIEYQRGNWEAAVRAYRRAAAHIREKAGPEDPALGTIRMNEAGALTELARYDEALAAFEAAITVLEASGGPDHPDVALALINRGIAFRFAGREAETLQDLRRAVAIFEEKLGPDHPYTAYGLTHLGGHLVKVGDLEGAEVALVRALAICEASYGEEHLQTALVLYELGELRLAQGDLPRAYEIWVRDVRVEEAVAGTADHPRVAQAKLRLAATLGESGESAESIRLCEEVVLSPEPLLRTTALEQLAREEERAGRPEAAAALYASALETGEPILGPDHPDVGRIREGRARALLASGSPEAALAEALRAESIARDHLRWTLGALSEREAFRYAAERAGVYDILVAIASGGDDPGTTGGAWDAVIRGRGAIFDEMTARRRLGHDPELGEDWRELERATTALANRIVRGPDPADPAAHSDAMAAARAAVEAAERRLADRATELGRSAPRHDVGFREVTAGLAETDALVAFLQTAPLPFAARDRAAYVAFLVRGDGSDPEVLPLGSALVVEEAVARWRETVDEEPRDGTRNRQEGDRLRDLVWRPIARRLGADVRTVFIVPDGALNRISWLALPDAAHGYLVETGPLFHLLSTERDLVRLAGSGPAGEGLLALGGAAFDEREALLGEPSSLRGSARECVQLETLRFDPLPASAAEAEEVARIWSEAGRDWRFWRPAGTDVRLRTGSAATEAAVKTEAPGRRVIHVASHAYFLSECPSPGSVAAREAAQGLAAFQVESPLLLSGLACAGANYRRAAAPGGDDGLLTAQEIGTLDLSGVEWAVLSGCDTGAGIERTGEGVFGLRRAFELAGARSVITSLWRVDDEWARAWMVELYGQRHRGGRSTPESVRAASRAILERRREDGLGTHPFTWGAFAAAGDWR